MLRVTLPALTPGLATRRAQPPGCVRLLPVPYAANAATTPVQETANDVPGEKKKRQPQRSTPAQRSKPENAPPGTLDTKERSEQGRLSGAPLSVEEQLDRITSGKRCSVLIPLPEVRPALQAMRKVIQLSKLVEEKGNRLLCFPSFETFMRKDKDVKQGANKKEKKLRLSFAALPSFEIPQDGAHALELPSELVLKMPLVAREVLDTMLQQPVVSYTAKTPLEALIFMQALCVARARANTEHLLDLGFSVSLGPRASSLASSSGSGKAQQQSSAAKQQADNTTGTSSGGSSDLQQVTTEPTAAAADSSNAGATASQEQEQEQGQGKRSGGGGFRVLTFRIYKRALVAPAVEVKEFLALAGGHEDGSPKQRDAMATASATMEQVIKQLIGLRPQVDIRLPPTSLSFTLRALASALRSLAIETKSTPLTYITELTDDRIVLSLRRTNLPPLVAMSYGSGSGSGAIGASSPSSSSSSAPDTTSSSSSAPSNATTSPASMSSPSAAAGSAAAGSGSGGSGRARRPVRHPLGAYEGVVLPRVRLPELISTMRSALSATGYWSMFPTTEASLTVVLRAVHALQAELGAAAGGEGAAAAASPAAAAGASAGLLPAGGIALVPELQEVAVSAAEGAETKPRVVLHMLEPNPFLHLAMSSKSLAQPQLTAAGTVAQAQQGAPQQGQQEEEQQQQQQVAEKGSSQQRAEAAGAAAALPVLSGQQLHLITKAVALRNRILTRGAPRVIQPFLDSEGLLHATICRMPTPKPTKATTPAEPAAAEASATTATTATTAATTTAGAATAAATATAAAAGTTSRPKAGAGRWGKPRKDDTTTTTGIAVASTAAGATTASTATTTTTATASSAPEAGGGGGGGAGGAPVVVRGGPASELNPSSILRVAGSSDAIGVAKAIVGEVQQRGDDGVELLLVGRSAESMRVGGLATAMAQLQVQERTGCALVALPSIAREESDNSKTSRAVRMAWRLLKVAAST